MSNEKEDCCGNLDNWETDKFKDILVAGDFWYTVYINYCTVCGKLDDDNTWVE